MGLDISVHGKLEPVSDKDRKKLDAWRNDGNWDGPECGDDLIDRTIHLNPKQSWPERLAGLEPGWYKANRQGSFRAGSYSGYNHWREQLCFMALRTTPAVIWHGEEEEKRKGQPFIELVCFSDSEGAIGPEVAKKLHKDFVDWKGRAEEFAGRMDPDDGEYFLDKYDEWTEAFRIASDGGVVDFC